MMNASGVVRITESMMQTRKILVALTLFFVFTGFASAQTVIEDFEDQDLSDWEGPDTNSLKIESNVVAEGSYSGRLDFDGSNEYVWKYTGKRQTNDIRFYTRNPDDSDNAAYVGLCGNCTDFYSGNDIAFIQYANGDMNFVYSSSFQVSYDNNEWYEIHIKNINYSTHKFDVQINDSTETVQLEKQDLSFRNNVDSGPRFLMRNSQNGGQNSNYVDYIRMGSGPTGPTVSVNSVETNPSNPVDGDSTDVKASVSSSNHTNTNVQASVYEDNSLIVDNQTMTYSGNDVYWLNDTYTSNKGNSYEINVYADNNGVTSKGTHTYSVDNQAPTVDTLKTDPDNPFYPNLVDVQGKGSDPDDSSLDFYMDVLYEDSGTNTTQISDKKLDQAQPLTYNQTDAFEITQKDTNYWVGVKASDGTDNSTTKWFKTYSTPTTVDIRDSVIDINRTYDNQEDVYRAIPKVDTANFNSSEDQAYIEYTKTNSSESGRVQLKETSAYSGYDLKNDEQMPGAGWRELWNYEIQIYDNSNSSWVNESFTDYVENDPEFSIDYSNDVWSDWNNTDLETRTVYGDFVYNITYWHSEIEADNLETGVYVYNGTGQDKELDNYYIFESGDVDNLETNTSERYELLWGNPTLCFYGVCVDNIESLDTVEMDFTVKATDNSSSTGLGENRTSVHNYDDRQQSLLDNLIDSIRNIVNGVISVIQSVIQTIIDYVLLILEAIFLIIVSIVNIIVQLIGFIITIIGNTLQFLVFNISDIDYNYNNTTYDNISDTPSELRGLLEGNTTLEVGQRQGDVFDSLYGLQNKTLITYRNDYTLFRYRVSALAAQFLDREVNSTNIGDPVNNPNTLNNYTSNENLEYNVTDRFGRKECGFCIGFTDPQAGGDDNIKYVNKNLTVPRLTDDIDAMIWIDSTAYARSIDANHYMRIYIYNVSKMVTRTVEQEITDGSDTQSARVYLDINKENDTHYRFTTNTTESNPENNYYIHRDNAEFYQWEVYNNDPQVSDAKGLWITQWNSTVDEWSPSTIQDFNIVLPFPKIFDPLGTPIGSVAIGNFFIILVSWIIGIIPDPIKNVVWAFISSLGSILELITKILSWTVTGVDWLLDKGIEYLYYGAILGGLYKGMHYFEMYQNGVSTSEIVDTAIHDAIEIFDTVIRIVVAAQQFANQMFAIMVHIVNTIRGIIRGI